MAKISAHGQILGTIEYLTKSIRYMSDGKLLINNGFGWKLAKVKAGVTVNAEAFERAKERHAAHLADRPALAQYRKQLHDLCGVGKRIRTACGLAKPISRPSTRAASRCSSEGRR